MKSFIQYIQEVSDEQINSLEHNNRPFNNIFGDKIRIVIPLRSDRTDHKLINDLSKKGYVADLDKDVAVSNVSTFQCDDCNRMIQAQSKPKQCPTCKSKKIEPSDKVVKQRKERIGTVISNLSKQDPEWKNYLNWWAKNKGKKADEATTGISIIISRSPIDVIRMSDHKEFNSCHSPPGSKNTTGWKNGSYFHCATQEAKTGGAIAYAVHTSDLKKVDLQANEIFKDRDRQIDGIEPLERQKLQRWTNGKIDILLPLPKTYGIKHIDFQETIIDYLKQVQKNIIDFSNPPDFDEFDLKGGSYPDKPADEIWNNFFDTNVSGDKESIDKDEEKNDTWGIDQLDNIAGSSLREHQKKWKHVYASYDADESDGVPYISGRGEVSFEFDVNLFNQIPDEQDLRTYGREKNLGKIIKDELSINVEEIYVRTQNNKVMFIVQINHENDGYEQLGRPATLNEFEGLLDELDEIEDNYNEHYAVFMGALTSLQFIKDWTNQQLIHFKIDKESYKPEVRAVSEEIWLGDLQGIISKNINRKIKNYQKYDSNIITLDFDLQSNSSVIFPFSTIPSDCLIFKSNLPMLRSQEEIINTPYKIFLQLSIPLQNKKVLHTIKSIDQRFEYYEKRAIQWWNNIKPGLCDDKFSKYSARIPFKKFTPIQKQSQFNFGEWLIINY